MKIITGPPRTDGKARHIEVELHDNDSWNIDETLALLIAPILRHYRDEGRGLDHIGRTEASDFPGIGTAAESHDAERWKALLDELVWTFERLTAEDSTHIEEPDNTRVNNGLRLFGKYLRCLWT